MANKVKEQARVQICAGMTVQTVKRNGSDGQKLMAPLFDNNHDGVYSKQEAEHFNSYDFKTEDGKITIFSKNPDGSKQVTEIKYDNFEGDVFHTFNGETLNRLGSYTFKDDKGKSCFFSCIGNYAKAVIDMVKGTVQITNGKCHNINGRNIELTIEDSDLERVGILKSKLNLQNTKDVGLFFDSATKVEAGGESIVNNDNASKVEITTKK